MEDKIVFYVLKIGKKYYGWSNLKDTMVLKNNIDDAYFYTSLKEVEIDKKNLEDEGVYKNSKKKILVANCEFKELGGEQ